MTLGKAVTPDDYKKAHQLKAYWTKPGNPGYIKIAWGTPGDFSRCVALLGKYVSDPEGLCSNYHVAATGARPGHAPGESKGH
jgi:hypothetical protein